MHAKYKNMEIYPVLNISHADSIMYACESTDSIAHIHLVRTYKTETGIRVDREREGARMTQLTEQD